MNRTSIILLGAGTTVLASALALFSKNKVAKNREEQLERDCVKIKTTILNAEEFAYEEIIKILAVTIKNQELRKTVIRYFEAREKMKRWTDNLLESTAKTISTMNLNEIKLLAERKDRARKELLSFCPKLFELIP